MALKPTLSLKQTQTIALTPELRQSLAMLCLSTGDLIEHIHTEALENPLLVVTAPRTTRQTSSAYDVALNLVAATITLGESVRRQLATQPLPRKIRDIAIYLTGDLADTGYLETDITDAANTLGATETEIELAIRAIQTCEPNGVGARNLTENLLLQMVEKGVPQATAKGALDNIPLLVNGQWNALSELLGVAVSKLEPLGPLLRSLNPEPVVADSTTTRHLIADIIVEDDENRGLSVSLSKNYLPDLSLDTDLLSQAKADTKAREYIKAQSIRAKTLIRAVQYRGETLLRVARAIVSHQHRFFVDGSDYLSPLTRRTLAETLDLHPSTIGRAIAGKNLDLNGTLFPMSFFLGSGLKKGASFSVSSYVVQQTIRKMIEQETPNSPLSDDKIVKKLNADGVDIARRTVAKYRRCMNIPSSFVRRQIAAAQQAPHNTPGHRNHLNR